MDKNRRGFITWLAGFFGLGAVTGATAIVPEKRKLEGFIVFFIGVGSLPPFKAEAMVANVKSSWKTSERHLIANWEPIWIPSRTQETHAEFYPVNGKMDAEGRLQQIELLDYTDEAAHSGAAVNIADLYLKTRTLDYVLLMLGVPVTKVELSRQQLNCTYDNVIEHIKSTGDAVNSIYLTEQFVKEGTLAFAKMFFGRIRIQGDGCVEDSDMSLDVALAFYDEGKDEIAEWIEKLKEMM